MAKRAEKTALGFCIFLAIATRLFFLALYRFQLEAHEWSEMARNLLQGRGYLFHWEWQGAPLRAFGYPGIPVLFSLLHFTGQRNVGVFIVYQFCLGGLATFLTYRLARLFSDAWQAALCAALILAIEPALALYGSIKVQETSLVVVLVAALALLAAEKRILLLGVALGLAAYVRPTLTLFLPALFLAQWQTRTLKREDFKKFIAATAIVFALTFPWMVRNRIVTGAYMFSSQNTYSFWKGNNPLATGTSLTLDGRSQLEASGYYEKTLKMPEVERRAFFAQAAFTWIRKQPFSFLWMTIKKFFYFWWFPPTAGALYTPGWLTTYKFFYAIYIFFALRGARLAWKKSEKKGRELLATALIFLLLYALAQSLLYVEGRHRLVLSPLLAAFGGVGIYGSFHAKLRFVSRL